MKSLRYHAASITLVLACTTPSFAQQKQKTAPSPKQPSKAAIVQPACRLIWQDDSSTTIQWADLKKSPEGWALEPQSVDQFPKLDTSKQKFVQMEQSSGLIVLGIRDDEDGQFQSGWIAMDSGVFEEEHGDHSHWRYKNRAKVIAQKLDADQGNPAHVYQYSGDIYIANDKKNGFTRILSSKMMSTPNSSNTTFFNAGGNHITLAVVDKKIAYATWPDREGENTGRIDVVSLDPATPQKPFQLQLPVGGLHGAITNEKKVFFAPSDGVYWLNAAWNPNSDPNNTPLNHLKLGTDPSNDKALRTGAFENHSHFVLFVSGSLDSSFLGIIDARAADPSVQKVAIPTTAGCALTTPKCIVTKANKHYAFVFSDRKGSEEQESLHIVDLDPNNDGSLSDAAVCKTIPVGESKIEGHGGHHSVCFSPNRRLAFISNPGDGTIWVMTLSDLMVESKIPVGGTPSKVVAIGE